MLTAGLVGGSLLITGGVNNRRDPASIERATPPQRVPLPRREAVATQHTGAPVLLGHMRGLYEQ